LENVMNLLGRGRRLLKQSGAGRPPLRSVTRRVSWRLHWMMSSKPIVLSDWWSDVVISLPHSGSAAHVFYERGPTEPDIAAALVERLPSGGVFVDVGAHIGLYSLIAARLVGPSGRVYAIEPQSACSTAIDTNVSLNAFDNVVSIATAVGDRDGEIRFSSNARSMGGMIAETGEATVPIMRLDTFARNNDLAFIDVLKLDAGGNEHGALVGAEELLADRRIGAVLCKLYSPPVVVERFGYDVSLIVQRLRDAGYLMSVLPSGMHPGSVIQDPGQVAGLFDSATYGRTLLAVSPQ
jgi:FkbM family methyltransferase